MRKSDRKMIANMFSLFGRLITTLFYEDSEDKEKEILIITDQMDVLNKEIDVWVEEE